VLKVNRLDSAHVRRGDTLIVPLWPVAFSGDSSSPPRFAELDSLALSPFPRRIDALSDTSRCFLVSLRVQAFAAFDSGHLVRWGPVSSGRKDMPTPVGLYHTNWKDKHRISTFDDEWVLRWYLNMDNFHGVSMHQYELPGRPASHSCIRLLELDAIWAYGWAEQWILGPDRRTILRHGTPVSVFGAWAWGERAPWKRLPEDPDAVTLSSDEIAEAVRMITEGVRPRHGTAAAPPAPVPDRARASQPRLAAERRSP
jgi:hypothetical protein